MALQFHESVGESGLLAGPLCGLLCCVRLQLPFPRLTQACVCHLLVSPPPPPPEGAPRLVPETQREPGEKNGEAQWLWPKESGPFLQGPWEGEASKHPGARELA